MVDSVGSTNTDLQKLGLGLPEPAQKQALGQEDFLKLMLTQLRNQDPFKPMDSDAFLGQLAQFGTVSGLSGLQTSFDSLSTSLVSNQALQAATLVGKSALVESPDATIAAGQALDGAVDLPAATGGVRIAVRDGTGQIVRELQLGAQPSGLAKFHWDGTLADGSPAPSGQYSFVAEYQGDTSMEAATTLVSAPVDSVLFTSDGFSVQVRGVGEVPFTSVRQIGND